jgi:porin
MRLSALSRLAAAAGALLSLACATPAAAESKSPFQFEAAYRVDLFGVADGGLSRGARYLDNVSASLDVDLDRAVRWKGAKTHFNLLNNFGGRPNDLAGTLQGVDNIEVGERRLKLYEAWIEQDLAGGAGTVRAGLYDVNSEFYVTDPSGLLINPSFGVGPEFAATGPGGPSIFPSTSLAVRAEVRPGKTTYVRAVALNAQPGDPGDRGGVDVSFDEGLLLVAEAGWEGPVRLALGVWRYTRDQGDLREFDPMGNPKGRSSEGVYGLAEAPLAGKEGGRLLSAFLRGGLSDGDTGPFRGSVVGGLLLEQPFRGRPDSALSAGVAWARLSDKLRASALDLGERLASAETVLELTYSDKVLPRLTLQPDVQYVLRPGGSRTAGSALVLGLRATVGL